KIDRIGRVRPVAVEEIGVENLQSEGNPAASGRAVCYASIGLADAAIRLFDVGNQLLRDGVAVRAAVGRVDLIRITPVAGAVEIQREKLRPIAPAAFAALASPATAARESRGKSSDVNAQRIAFVRVLGKTARQCNRSTEIHRPAVEFAKQFRLQLDIFD